MRRTIGVIMSLCMAAGASLPVWGETVFDNTDMAGVNAYEAIIEGISDAEGSVKIIDMDNDSVPELVVNDNGGYIYTLEGSSPKEIYSTGAEDNGEIAVTKDNDGKIHAVVIKGEAGNDEWYEYDFIYKNGNAMERSINTAYNSTDINNRYSVDGVTVSKNIYDGTMKKYMDFIDSNDKEFEYIPKFEMDSAETALNIVAQAKRDKDTSLIRIYINGEELVTDNVPVIKNGTTMVPMRDIFEALDSNINWDSATKTVIATRGNVAIQLTVNSNAAIVNGEENVLNEVPFINENQTTMVPLRFISESLGADVEWNGTERSITITI